jgi:hypothetical protein
MLDLNNETLQLALVWLVSGGGAGTVAYWFLEREFVKDWLADLSSEYKRYLALTMAFLLGDVGYALLVAIGTEVAPVGTLAWIKALVAAGSLAAGLGQVVHGRRRLRNGS